MDKNGKIKTTYQYVKCGFYVVIILNILFVNMYVVHFDWSGLTGNWNSPSGPPFLQRMSNLVPKKIVSNKHAITDMEYSGKETKSALQSQLLLDLKKNYSYFHKSGLVNGEWQPCIHCAIFNKTCLDYLKKYIKGLSSDTNNSLHRSLIYYHSDSIGVIYNISIETMYPRIYNITIHTEKHLNRNVSTQALLSLHSTDKTAKKIEYTLSLPQKDTRKYLFSFLGDGLCSSPNVSGLGLTLLSIASKFGSRVYVQSQNIKNSLSCTTEAEDLGIQSMSERQSILKSSTFTLILAERNVSNYHATYRFQQRLIKALEFCSIPIVVKSNTEMPLTEMVSWQNVIVNIENGADVLNWLIKADSQKDLVLYYQRNITLVFNNLLSSNERLFDALLCKQVLKSSLQFGSLQDHPTLSYNRNNDTGVYTPLLWEATKNSPTVNAREHPLWNDWKKVYNSICEESAQWVLDRVYTENIDMVLIEKVPGFTVVIPTMNREPGMLVRSLLDLKGLPGMKKVIIVWNNVLNPPTANLSLPEIGVEITLVAAKKNSLNNRFIPYTAIETDCVLSLDDDVIILHDELTLAYNTWKQNRNRLVGSIVRSHTHVVGRGNSWKYNYNGNVISIVLTGTAFIHKFYFYLFTYYQPRQIYSYVEKHINCEDIAMNMMISHVTRKPPVRVKSKLIEVLCKNCKGGISRKKGYTEERQACLSTFAEIYGYMPLLTAK